ncbi:MAG: phage major capsid protein [Betaproteobacteria bacterium]|nr:phage major capsid protein [Betaproteobacteria bacterium]
MNAQDELLRAARIASSSSELNLPSKTASDWGMMRLLRGAISGRPRDHCPLEYEISEAGYKQLGIAPRGANCYLIPPDVLRTPWARGTRAGYVVGTASSGGNVVATQLLSADFIEVLRNASVTGRLGARYITGAVGNLDISTQLTQSQAYWVSEGSAPTESEATFGKVSLRPKTLCAFSKYSRQMILQSTPDIEILAREDLAATVALGIDLAAISGSGSGNEPLGIINQPSIGSVAGGANGANLTFDHLIELYAQPLEANAPQANLGFAMNAKCRGYLATLKSNTGSYLWSIDGGVSMATPSTIVGYPYTTSNQLRSNLTKGTSTGSCSELVFGNWRELLIATWGGLEIAVNPYDATGFTTGDVLIRAFQTLDISVRHAASFAVMSDALTPGF